MKIHNNCSAPIFKNEKSPVKAFLLLAGLWLMAMTVFPVWQTAEAQETEEISTVNLSDIYMRDGHVLVDEETETYYIVSSASGARVRAYKSTDLVNWEGPHIVYETPDEMWGTEVDINSIWAPELHKYNGKYYLFVTFSSNYPMSEQWEDWFEWRTRVWRGSQILVSDTPLGPYEAFSNEPQIDPALITLDGTLWEEDGIPYMIYCHEWVQIVDGAISMVQLSEDLSETVGEYEVMFRGSAAAWNRPGEPTHWVTDGPWFYTSKSGKLFMVWSGFSHTGYTVGLAVSESGRLEGPWVQQDEPLYSDDGGHPALFETFDGRLVMSLHSPNGGPETRQLFFEMEDTGETLRIVRQLDN
ncbi:MAG: glycoside hydrolase family 43 protein [Balneolaceae bacterium]